MIYFMRIDINCILTYILIVYLLKNRPQVQFQTARSMEVQLYFASFYCFIKLSDRYNRRAEAPLELTDARKRTAMHYAAESGQSDNVQWLISQGAAF